MPVCFEILQAYVYSLELKIIQKPQPFHTTRVGVEWSKVVTSQSDKELKQTLIFWLH